MHSRGVAHSRNASFVLLWAVAETFGSWDTVAKTTMLDATHPRSSIRDRILGLTVRDTLRAILSARTGL